MKIEKIYNQEAEANVLSSILVRNDSICEVIDVLNDEDLINHVQDSLLTIREPRKENCGDFLPILYKSLLILQNCLKK